MSRKHLLGALPRIQSGANKGRLDRPAAALVLGVSGEELHQGYNLWVQLFRTNGCLLTLEQYFLKLKEAGISVRQLGNKLTDYHLARYGDVGPYSWEGCRFITKAENLREQNKSSIYARTLLKYGPEKTREMQRSSGRKGGLLGGKGRHRKK